MFRVCSCAGEAGSFNFAAWECVSKQTLSGAYRV